MVENNKSELKGADAIQTRLAGILGWIVDNSKTLGLFLLPLLIVGLAGLGWQQYAKRQKGARMDELAAVEQQFEKESEDAANKAISSTIDGGKAATDPASRPKPDHSGSQAAFLALFRKYPDREEGWTAGLRAANIMLDKDNPEFDAASKEIAAVVEKSTASAFHQVVGRSMHMAVLEESKQYDDAMKQASALLGLVNDDFKPRVLLGKARIELAKNSKDDAKATLNTIIEKHAGSEEAATARAMLSVVPAN
jgi:predicted negative regulator of RcsB-dependent stress response